MSTIAVTDIKSNTAATPTVFKDSAGVEVGQLATAWVNFDGTTGAIRSSFNVASMTVLSTGNFRVTFSNPMANVNYAVVATGQGTGSGALNYNVGVLGANNLGYVDVTSLLHSTFTWGSSPHMHVAIFGGK